jgi:hypothetical protein
LWTHRILYNSVYQPVVRVPLVVLDGRLVESEILKINNSTKQNSPARTPYCVLTINLLLMLHRNYISESELLYDCRFTANQFVLTTSPLRLTTSNFIFQLNTCGYNPYVTSSLTRGWVWFSPA